MLDWATWLFQYLIDYYNNLVCEFQTANASSYVEQPQGRKIKSNKSFIQKLYGAIAGSKMTKKCWIFNQIVWKVKRFPLKIIGLLMYIKCSCYCYVLACFNHFKQFAGLLQRHLVYGIQIPDLKYK